MKILKVLAVTFSQYSRIPMPHFEWKAEDMRYSMSAFPLVGAVIGLVFAAVWKICSRFLLPVTASAMLLTAVPLIITGGFHADGFMDVCDALSSYRDREEKLAILKDPHIGAFAVIRSAVAALIYIASLVIILSADGSEILVYALAAGFVLSRGLSALAVLTFRSARNEGMLYYEATAAADARTVNLVFTAFWIAAAAFAAAYIAYPGGALMLCAACGCFSWYKYISYKEFGGITGDTAGWFVVVCETAMAVCGAVSAILAG